ncbi:hypothetical protein OESDEN_24544 [Oesophagostomum dentatum]|uniref:Nematode fatty acid retinoid binding protein n=1 Tax=Oesophagostomum dentatum TaxID=61180 RepID=A0A0B1RT43_OESDE|nr:hypothetical protein OESDEN_24544 [Oesophagostomum dentatum]
MLWRIFVIAAVCLHGASAKDPEKESQALMERFAPEDMWQFSSSLNEKDFQVFSTILKEDPFLEFKSAKEYVDKLRQKSTTLAEKMKKTTDAIHNKIMQLEPESQTFAKELLEDNFKTSPNETRAKQRKEMILYFMDKYAAMSAKAKNAFGQKFPRLAASFSDPALRTAITAIN